MKTETEPVAEPAAGLPADVIAADKALSAATGERDLGSPQNFWEKMYRGAMSERTWYRYMKVWREGHPWLAAALTEGKVSAGGAVAALGYHKNQQALAVVELEAWAKQGHRVPFRWVLTRWVPDIVADHLKSGCAEEGCAFCDFVEPIAACWAEDKDVLAEADRKEETGRMYIRQGQRLLAEAAELRKGL